MIFLRCGIAFLLLSPALFAQQNCGNSFQLQVVQCVSGSCSGSVFIETPSGPPYAIFYRNPVSCCGFSIPSYNVGGGECLIALRNPELLEQLARISSKRDVLVARCDGQYDRLDGSRVKQNYAFTPRETQPFVVKSKLPLPIR
jgi:hypothetical protein